MARRNLAALAVVLGLLSLAECAVRLAVPRPVRDPVDGLRPGRGQKWAT